jgi:peptidoglycan/LPS O-acetylase OafA/YrhL
MQSKADFPQFTGLRGIAALLVLFFHLRTPQNLELHFGLVDAFSRFGFLGVDIFFVLSGFILSHVYGAAFSAGVTGTSLRNYAVARFARIYPLHLLTTAMMLGAYGVALHIGVSPNETSGYSWVGFILSLLLVQEWFGVVAPNPGSWSISVEFASYLLFPFLVFPLLKLPRLWPLALIAAGALAVDHFESMRVARSMIEFVMGCAAYVAARHHNAGPASAAAGIAFVVPFLASEFAGHETHGLAALCFAATVFLLAGDGRDPFKRLCATRPAVFLGEISYSVYLLQWFIWIGWKHVLAKAPFLASHPYALVLGAAASVILCAAISFRYFESPARSALRRFRPQPAAAS